MSRSVADLNVPQTIFNRHTLFEVTDKCFGCDSDRAEEKADTKESLLNRFKHIHADTNSSSQNFMFTLWK